MGGKDEEKLLTTLIKKSSSIDIDFMKKKPFYLTFIIIALLLLAGCGSKPQPVEVSSAEGEIVTEDAAEPGSEDSDSKDSGAGSTDNSDTPTEENVMTLKIMEKEVPVTWEENQAVKDLRSLAPLTISMHMYGGFEQVGPIGTELTSDDTQMTTDFGDIVLYSGDQIVIFYGSNSWAYTKLGHIDLSKDELEEMLSNGDVEISIQ